MSEIVITGQTGSVGNGDLQLQNADPMDGTLRFVTDALNTASPLKLSTAAVQATSAITANAFIPSSSTVPANGLFLPAANTLALATNTTERMRIDSNGNCGIGTTSPTFTLDISGQIRSTTSTNVSGLTLNNTTAASYSQIGFDGDNADAYIFKTNSTNNTFGGANSINIYNEGTIAFHSSTTTNIMYLAAGGNVGIGTTAATARLQVKGSGSTAATTALLVQNSAGTQILRIDDDTQMVAPRTQFTSAILVPYINTQNDAYTVIQTNPANGNARFYYFVSVGTSSDPVASAALEIVSTSKGFLPPRMTTAQKVAISSPAAGLVVYDTTLNKLCVFTSAWETITSV